MAFINMLVKGKVFETSNSTGKVVVPNGHWALTASSGSWTDAYDCRCFDYSDDVDCTCPEPFSTSERVEAVGPAPTMTTLSYESFGLSGSRVLTLFYSEEPFGVIEYTTENGEPQGGKQFRSARQITKGNFGTFAPMPKLTTVRQAQPNWSDEHEGVNARRRRDYKRNTPRWVRLSELAQAVNMPVLEVVQRYFEFTDYEKHPHLQVVHGDADYIKSHTFANVRHPIAGVTPVAVYVARDITHNWAARVNDTTWIRQGWAAAVLRMHGMGYIPEPAPELFPVTTSAA